MSAIISHDVSDDKHVGLLAAWGRYPITVAETLRQQGYKISCLGVKRHCDPAIADLCDDFQWLNAAKLGQAIRYFRRRGVRHATMAGKFHKVEIYQPWAWFRYIPDLTFLRTFYPHFIGRHGDRKDDTLLGTLCKAFSDQGIQFLPATDFAPELLVQPGQIAGRQPTLAQQADIAFGWEMAKQMGGLDIGQSVCVKDRAVIAVEAIEGTDQCIGRAGELCRQGGFTVVKVAKPNQDMRFDVPTVGIGTLETMVAAGAKTLAIDAHQTILLDPENFRAFAQKHRLSVVALSAAELADCVDSADAA